MTQYTQAWELPRADRIEGSDNLNWSEAAKFTEQRLEILERVSRDLKQQEENFIQGEERFVNDSLRFLETFDRHNQEFIRQEEENVRRVEEEINRFRPEQERNEALINEVRNEIRTIEERNTASGEQRRKLEAARQTFVDQITPSELAKLKFKDPQDPTNDIFKWVYETVYKGSRVDYSWKVFNAQAFKKGKEADFLNGLKTLQLATIRKSDAEFGKLIYDRKTENLAALEVKNKENKSLRNLIDYIGNVVEAEAVHNQIITDKVLLEEKNKDLEKRVAENGQLSAGINLLREKIQHSQHFITTLNGLKPYLNNVTNLSRERLGVQNDYINSIKGSPDALGHLAERTSQRNSQLAQSGVNANTYTHEQIQESPYHREVQAERLEQYETVKEQRSGAPIEDEQFAGEQSQNVEHGKKVESKHPLPAVDLKESQFASSNKGSCETCTIF